MKWVTIIVSIIQLLNYWKVRNAIKIYIGKTNYGENMKFYVLSHYPSEFEDYRRCILLIHDHWDDWFQYETQCYVHYVPNSGDTIYIGEVKIGQINMGEKQRTAAYPNQFTSLSNNFFSLGQSEDYYDKIKSIFNDKERMEFYRAMRDVAFDLEMFKCIRNLNVTKVSLMRSVSDFMIKQQFHRIAIGNARLTSYDIKYTYPSKYNDDPPTLSFHVEPNSCPPTNIHVVIGRNNVGKTYLIKHLIAAAYDNTSNAKENGVLRATNVDTGRLVNSRRQAFANILCVSFSPFDDYNEIIQLHKSKEKAMPFSFIGLNYNEGTLFAKSFVQSLVKCQCSNRKMQLLKNALNVLETDPIFAQSKLHEMIELQCNNDNEISKSKENQTEVQKIYGRLSSGHQVIMISLIQLVERITERTLVILDEPENHLHPPLLSAFIRSLSELLIEQNGVAIISTHSPVILQEVPKSCVWKINRSGYEVSVSRLEIESFGATIGALTHEVFGLEVNNSGFHKMLIDEVKSGSDYNQILDKFGGELGDEAKALLRSMIFERSR